MSEIQDRLEYLLDKEREKVEKLQSRLSHLSAVNEKPKELVKNLDCECDSYQGVECGRCKVLKLADEMGEK